VKLSEARRFALSLPDATEEPHFEKSSFRVGGKIFATIPEGGRHLNVFVDEHEVRASVAEDPDAFGELWWGKKLSGLQVTLAKADSRRVREMLEDAWRRRAPKRLIAALDATEMS
jgi:hypothetical protein